MNDDVTRPAPPAASPTSPRAGVLPGEHLHALRSRLRGDLVLPEDPDWDDARRAWMLLVDQRPTAVVVAADAADVVETVRSARKLGLRVAPQGTGHAAGTLPDLRDTILLRTARLAGVEVDPEAGVARVGAGATWADVAAAAGEHGLAAVAGMAPSVGVAGLTLGGGLGWLARSHGLAAAGLLAIEGVDARGEVVRADATQHEDLLWAARGGSLPLVVTALELRLHRLLELSAGALVWPIERATEVVTSWRAWTDGTPETVTSLARVLRYPPLPEIPEPLRGRSLVAVEVAVQADAAAVDALLAPLRALHPELDSVRPMAPAELASVHGDPPQPVPAHGDAVVLGELSEPAIAAFLEAALRPEAGPLLSIEVRQLGGMLAPGRTDGAVSGVDGAGLVYVVGIVPVPQAGPAVVGAASAVIDAMAPHASGRLPKTFAERPADATALYGDAAGRLREIRDTWDPDGVVVTGHPLD